MFRAFTGCRTFATCAVLLEHNGTSILKSNAAAIKAAKKLAGSSEVIGVAVMKKSGEKPEMSQLHGLSKLITVDVGSGDFRLSEQMASILADVHKQLGGCITHWLTPHSSSGKDLFPRLASVLEAKTAVVADITEVLGENSFKRPIYAGNAVAEVETDADAVKIVTVRPTAFQSVKIEGQAASEIKTLKSSVTTETLTAFVDEQASKSERPELGNAEIVISGGRALKSAENFSLVYTLADKLKAAVGASRAAVDAGYVPNELQVGQTGKVVAPKLYVAIGISGAIQHVAGMKDSQVIVAINKDGESPIFKIADYGLVGDLFKIVPELTEKLPQL